MTTHFSTPHLTHNPSTSAKRHPLCAFSLIEVLIAVAIAGIAFFAFTQAFFNTLKAMEGLKIESDNTQDIRFVRSQIINEPDLDTFEEGGEITTLDLGRVDWYAEVEETETVDLFRVRLIMEFENPDGEPFEQRENLFLLRPTWSDPIERSSLMSEAQKDIESEARRRDW